MRTMKHYVIVNMETAAESEQPFSPKDTLVGSTS